MEIGAEIRTDKGIATVVGETEHYLYSVHLSPEPMAGVEFHGEILIIFAFKDVPQQLVGALRFNDVVEHGANEQDLVIPETGSTVFTASECKSIDVQTWKVLIKKYRIGPSELILPDNRSIE